MPDLSEIANRYDDNAARYDDATRYNRDAARRLVASLPPGRYANVLDVGCGTGFASIAMVERFRPSRVSGVDISAQMLDRMRDKFTEIPDVTLDLHVADVLTMPVPDRAFDCVLASMALHWFPARDQAMSTMAAKVAPEGVLALVAPGPGHDREYVEVLRTVAPAVPQAVIDVFHTAQVFPDEVEDLLTDSGLEAVDIWVETRHRRVPPDRYMARITTVGSHVWTTIMGAEEAEAMVARVTSAVRRASGSRGFEYTFTKTYAVARKPSA